MKSRSMVEEQIESMKIEAAMRQGYEICHAHYPSAVMVSEDGENWTCPECGNTTYTGADKNKGEKYDPIILSKM